MPESGLDCLEYAIFAQRRAVSLIAQHTLRLTLCTPYTLQPTHCAWQVLDVFAMRVVIGVKDEYHPCPYFPPACNFQSNREQKYRASACAGRTVCLARTLSITHTNSLHVFLSLSLTHTRTQVSVRKLGASRSLPAGLLMRTRRPPLLDGAPGAVNNSPL